MAVKKIKLPKNHQAMSTSRIMLWVLAACIPGILALTVFFGWGTLINICWLSLWALAFEALALSLRKRNIMFYLKDYSALVTALLLAVCIPPGVPWWLGICGAFFAIVIAKQLYGGLGHNLFNPAMVAYAVLLLAFPVEMTSWVQPRGVGETLPGLFESLQATFLSGSDSIDAYTGATAMDLFRNERGALMVSEFKQQTQVFGSLSGLGWEWVNGMFLLGGLWLMYKRIISWQIPLAMLAVIGIMAALFYDGGSSSSGGSPLLHLFGGGTMLAAFFIATDPVTASTTPRGRLVYGALIGFLTYLIRVWGAYPDGIAFAVLLGNFAAPLIDHFTQPEPSHAA